MHRKLAPIVWLGLICLSPPSYCSELLDELIALLPAQNQQSDQEVFHPDLKVDREESDEKLLTYSLKAEEIEERFSLPNGEIALLKTAKKKKLKRTPTNLIDELNPTLTPKRVEKPRAIEEKKPTASLESSHEEHSVKPSLSAEKQQKISNKDFTYEKEIGSLGFFEKSVRGASRSRGRVVLDEKVFFGARMVLLFLFGGRRS